MGGTNGRDVFISYASPQADIAMRFCELLEAKGASCWIAPRDVPAARGWRESAALAIEDARLFVVLLSADGIMSTWVDREMRWAIDSARPVLPVVVQHERLSRSMDFLLGDIHRLVVDDLASHVGRVAEAAWTVLNAVDRGHADEHVSQADTAIAPPVVPPDPYVEKVTTHRPAYFLMLLDCSHSMSQRLTGTSFRKREAVASTVNSLLYGLLRASRRTDGYRHFFDVSVLGYGLGPTGRDVEPLLDADRVAVPDLYDRWRRIEDEERIQIAPDGTQHRVRLRQPIWVEPTSAVRGHTVMARAFARARELAEAWVAENQSSIPPVVLNVTDGDWTDGDPTVEVRRIQELTTTLGPALVLMCQLAGTAAGPESLMFPAELPQGASRRTQEMFELSSILPESMTAEARARKYTIAPGARGFALNSPLDRLVDFLQIGTKTLQ